MVENDGTNSYQNESYSGHKNNDFTDPLGYYSPLDFGYLSVDEHINEVKVEDHVDEVKVEAHGACGAKTRNVTFYESPNKMEEGKDKREWVIPSSTDVSFETIPTMILSTSDHALYKRAMFMGKEELKTSLKVLA